MASCLRGFMQHASCIMHDASCSKSARRARDGRLSRTRIEDKDEGKNSNTQILIDGRF